MNGRSKSLIGMRSWIVAVLVLAGTSLPSALGAMLDLPPFDHDFTASALSRGYWFQAPIDFTITGLRVPVDVGTEDQNIEVLRLNSLPPEWPSETNDFTSLFYVSGFSGVGLVPVNILVNAGDYIGVIGTRGTSTMHNSYALPGPYSTTFEGYPITLTRFGFQDNLHNTQAHDVWQEAAFNVSRVEMQYTPGHGPVAIPEPATLLLCSGALGLFGWLRARRTSRT